MLSNAGDAAPRIRVSSPLVLDLDGTLTYTDTLLESVLLLLKRSPWMIFHLVFWALQGPWALKSQVARRVTLHVAALPWRQDLLDWLRGQHAAGRTLVLATAAHRSVAQAAADHLQLFDHVLATDGGVNLKGPRKLAAIQALVGPDFVYAGDSRADLPIWSASAAVVLADVAPALAARIPSAIPVEARFQRAAGGLALWLKAIRVHQWVKNLLLLVPLFTAFAFNQADKVLAAGLIFVAFSLAASGTYVMNDLWDLENDRQHPRKKDRAFASGRIGVMAGVAAAVLLVAAGLLLALALSKSAALALAGYVVLTTAYSWTLKGYVLIDVITLALLYTYRVLAGAVATGIEVSAWLLAFSAFTFFSLALVKRCAELVTLEHAGRKVAQGRDYRVSDLVVLWPFGTAASVSAVVVFGLYASAPETAARFTRPQGLWLVALGMMYWYGRLWIKTARGEMDDDPIVFALRDRGSRIAVLAMAALFAGSHWF